MVKDAKKQSLHLCKSSFFDLVLWHKKGWISPAFQALSVQVLYLTDA